MPRLVADRARNVDAIERLACAATDSGASLVVFPEASLTGLVNRDDPVHDLPLGEPVPGPTTARLAALAADRHIWIAIGLLELRRGRLYDSAVLIAPDRTIGMQRRISRGWHGRGMGARHYGHGTGIAALRGLLGRSVILVCGDLFDDGLVGAARSVQPRLALVPMSRAFDDGCCDQARWESDELPHYAARARSLACPTLIANYLADPSLGDDASFGGAWAIEASGRVSASLGIGREGLLLATISPDGESLADVEP